MQLDDLVKRRNALRKAHPIRNFRPKKKAATLRDGLEKTREPDRREGSVGMGAPGCGNGNEVPGTTSVGTGGLW